MIEDLIRQRDFSFWTKSVGFLIVANDKYTDKYDVIIFKMLWWGFGWNEGLLALDGELWVVL